MIPRRAVIAAAIAVIAGVPAITFGLVVSPLQQQAAANDTTRVAVEGVNATQAARNGVLQRSGAAIGALDRRAAALDRALPAKPQIAALLAEVGRMSRAADVEIVSFTSGGVTAPTPQAAAAAAAPAPAATTAAATAQAGAAPTSVAQVDIDVQVRGTQDGVRDFVGALQRAKRVVGVTSVSLAEDSTGVATGTIAGVAYVLPASGTPGTTSPTSAPAGTDVTAARAAAR